MKFSFSIDPSPTLAMNALVQEKRKRGERVYNLGIGEAMVETPAAILQAATRAIKEGKTHYAPAAGIPELRAASAAWMNKTYCTAYAADETVVTCGGKFAIFALLHLLLAPGDEVIIFSPYWTSYPSMVRMCGGVPKILGSLQDLRSGIGERTKIVIINNACNPTGALYGSEELKQALSIAKEYDLFIISDEVYSGLTFDNKEFISLGSFSEHHERVAVIQSFSKHFAMAGWRVGLLFSPKEIAHAVADFQSQSTSGTSTISQWAALAAIEHASDVTPCIQKEIAHRRDVFVETWNSLFPTPITPPESGLYAFIPLSSFGTPERNSVAFCTRALLEAGVAMVPGSSFGAEGFARCSFGDREEEIVEGLRTLAEWVKNQ